MLSQPLLRVWATVGSLVDCGRETGGGEQRGSEPSQKKKGVKARRGGQAKSSARQGERRGGRYHGWGWQLSIVLCLGPWLCEVMSSGPGSFLVDRFAARRGPREPSYWGHSCSSASSKGTDLKEHVMVTFCAALIVVPVMSAPRSFGP